MRWIFLTLVLANVAYFLQHWYQQTEIRPVGAIDEVPAVQKGARLILWSEVPVQAVERQVEGPLVSEPASAAKLADIDAEQSGTGTDHAEGGAMRPVCTRVGPFNALETAENLRQRLLVLGLEVTVDAVQVAKSPDYWVYLDPLASRTDALREVKRLHKSRIDSYVIGDGDLANGVSLGLFTRESSAQRVRAEVEVLGYQPRVRVVERFDRRYWVALAPGKQGDLGESLWRELKGQFGFAERREVLCAESWVEESLTSPAP